MAKRLGLLPLLVCAVGLGKAADDVRLAAAVAAIATILALVGPRWELDRGRQLVISAMGVGVGYTLVSVVSDPHHGSLAEGWRRVATMSILGAAAQFVVVRPKGGWAATTTLGFAALVAIGEAHVEGYAAFVAVFLLTSLAARDVDGDARRARLATTPRIRVGAGILFVGGAIAFGATAGLHLGHAWLAGHGHSTAFMWTPRVGFSDQMDLGGLDGLLDSDAVVLRVRGPRVDYLRGAVLDVYAGGRWTRSDSAETDTIAAFTGDAPTLARVEIAAVSEETRRFFLPIDARRIVASPSALLVDRAGVVKRAGKHGLNVATFVRGERDGAIPAPEEASDLQLTQRIRPSLERLAAEWTGNAATTPEKLDAIERRLAMDFQYSRTFKHDPRLDPALDFLTRRKTGHCEYFATGMALVARAAGIPARFVVGYRVSEQSPFGYYVVRDRNAHAWVEAWIPGRGWATRDPTPDGALPQDREHRASYAASLVDALRVAYDDVTSRLGRLTTAQTVISSVVGFAVLFWIVARGAPARRAPTGKRTKDDAPLPCLTVLLSALEKAGYAHPECESIERFAARVLDAEAAELLGSYAALRYGSVGDPMALEEATRAYAMRARALPGGR